MNRVIAGLTFAVFVVVGAVVARTAPAPVLSLTSPLATPDASAPRSSMTLPLPGAPDARAISIAAPTGAEPDEWRSDQHPAGLPALEPIVVNAQSVALFERIPAEYRSAAGALRMVFYDKSVGANIAAGLDCLRGVGNNCPTPGSADYNNNWRYEWYAASGCGGWADIVPCFIRQAIPLIETHDVLMATFSYLETAQSGALTYYDSTPSQSEIGDYAAFLSAAGKPIAHWTSSLTNRPGEQMTMWNELARSYAASNGHALFDLADILSTRPDGSRCLIAGQPAICYPDYTSQTQPNAGHLNKAGQARVAKALWVFMARLAGWRPDVAGDIPAPTGTPTPPPTEIPPAPTPASTLPPRPTSAPARITDRQCRMIWSALTLWRELMPAGEEWSVYSTNSGQEPPFEDSELRSLIDLARHTRCLW